MFLDLLGVQIVMLFFEEVVGQATQIWGFLQVEAEFVHVLPRLRQQLVHDSDGRGFKTQAEFDGVCWDESARGGGHAVGVLTWAPENATPIGLLSEGMKLFRH